MRRCSKRRNWVERCEREKNSEEEARTYLVASGVDSLFPSGLRITRNTTSKSGTNNEVTNRGIACTYKC